MTATNLSRVSVSCVDSVPLSENRIGNNMSYSKEVAPYVRDERWEDMYACVAPYPIEVDDELVEMVKIGFYVWYKGMLYWNEQNLVKEDIDLINFEIFSFIMNEMVGMVDEHMKDAK